jgi:hypothetical protein
MKSAAVRRGLALWRHDRARPADIVDAIIKGLGPGGLSAAARCASTMLRTTAQPSKLEGQAEQRRW